jgi:hypothetical protein
MRGACLARTRRTARDPNRAVWSRRPGRTARVEAVLGWTLLTLAALSFWSAAGGARAARDAPPGVTINDVPSTFLAGDGVVIFGRAVGGPLHGGPTTTIALFEHLAGSSAGYTQVAETTTDAAGSYRFTLGEGAVRTNRSWFVRVAGSGVESRTVHASVAALVTLSASSHTVERDAAVTFTGRVRPARPGARVLLQEQVQGSDGWKTLGGAEVGADSDYAISHRWSESRAVDVRVLFDGDVRNADSASNPATVIVQQPQQSGFTIGSSSPVIEYGQTATISGVLDRAGTTIPEPDTAVLLRAHSALRQLITIAQTTTAADGRYSFTVKPTYSTDYQVWTFFPQRPSAVWFQAVRQTVSLTADSTESPVGARIRLSGVVLPDRTGRALSPGHAIYLQRFGSDDHWHTVEVRFVHPDSTFQFTQDLAYPGKFRFRARITGDALNTGSESAPVTITATQLATAERR